MTNKATQQFDFEAGAAKAREMTDEAIHYALVDIQKTLPYADRLDISDGGCRGGWYRDEASTLTQERERRRKQGIHKPRAVTSSAGR